MPSPSNRHDPGPRRERFEAIFRQHYSAVVAYARRRTTPELADDAVAETFMVAWRRLEEIPSEPLPWLFGVARKTLRTHRRTARRWQSLAERLQALAAPAAASDFDVESFDGSVARALARLSDKDRDAITLVAWEELTPKEAAAALGEPAVSFRVRLHRAKARLRRELAALEAAETEELREQALRTGRRHVRTNLKEAE